MKARSSACVGEVWNSERSCELIKRRSGVVKVMDSMDGGAGDSNGSSVGDGGGLLREMGMMKLSWWGW